MNDLILNQITKEIENNHNCKVLEIRYAELLSLCVRAKIPIFTRFSFVAN